MDENSSQNTDEAQNEIVTLQKRIDALEAKNAELEESMSERCRYFGENISKINRKFEITRIVFFVIILGMITIIYKNL